MMKPVIVTVDTESHVGNRPIENLIWGPIVKNKQCGIPLIMDMCDNVGAKALFFVDIAEAWDYGEEKIADIILYIKKRGHDVGVHIHPDHMADRHRMFLSEYSYDEQYTIIKKCTDLYKKITSENPKAFRAGKYGANRETLDILAELGYKADFSEFFGYDKWCHIQPPVTDNTAARLNNGIIEFPVMSYENYVRGLFHRFDKLDINQSILEHRYVLHRIEKQKNINIVSIFVHSFSLLRWRRNPDKPRLSMKEVRHLQKALQQVKNSNFLFFSSLNEILESDYQMNQDRKLSVFKVTGVYAMIFFIQKAFDTILSRLQIWIRNHTR